ncbi:MAG: hypothetical protein QM726_04375 [Chitinophagaceae bacterium]
MITKISKTDDLKSKLRDANKTTLLNQPEHVAAVMAMNEKMKEVRREFQVKDHNSQISASKVILTS